MKFDPRTKNESNSIYTLKPSQSRSRTQNQVTFSITETKAITTTHTETISISSLHWNIFKFHPPRWNQFNFDYPHQNQVNFDAHIKMKWFTVHLQKTNKLRLPILKPSQLIPTLKESHFRPAHEACQLWPPHENKSTSIPTPKPSQFRSLHQNQVNFDPPRESQVNFAPNTDVKSLSIPTLTQVNFDAPGHKTKLISIQTLNQVIFDPHTTTEFIPILKLKSSWIRSSTLKSSPCRPPTQQPSRFRCQH